MFARFYEDPGYDGDDAEQGRCREGIVPAVVGDEESGDNRSQDAADVAPMLPQRLIQPETEPVYLPPREMTEDQLALIAKPKAPRETDIQKMFIAGSAV